VICASCHIRKAHVRIREGNAIAVLCAVCVTLLGDHAPNVRKLRKEAAK